MNFGWLFLVHIHTYPSVNASVIRSRKAQGQHIYFWINIIINN